MTAVVLLNVDIFDSFFCRRNLYHRGFLFIRLPIRNLFRYISVPNSKSKTDYKQNDKKLELPHVRFLQALSRLDFKMTIDLSTFASLLKI